MANIFYISYTAKTILILLAIISAIALIIVSIALPTSIRTKKENWVIAHSVGLRKVKEINKKYNFKNIQSHDMSQKYDNENMYEDISPMDYLTYQLQFDRKKIDQALKDTLDNKTQFEEYSKELKTNCHYQKFDAEIPFRNIESIYKFEKRLIQRNILRPKTEFSLRVVLILTNINGDYKGQKKMVFTPADIKNIERKLSQKQGNFYTDRSIWDSICRVERGKVTNKMRFAVYQRDGYRCCKCNRKTDDLEVDHIWPIAKGGKSTFDNLQTLCHKCNVKKGANVE